LGGSINGEKKNLKGKGKKKEEKGEGQGGLVGQQRAVE